MRDHHRLHSAQSKLTASKFLRVKKLTYHVRHKYVDLPTRTQCVVGARQVGENVNAPKLTNVDFITDRIHF